MFSTVTRPFILGAALLGLIAVPVLASDKEHQFRVKRAPIAKALLEFAKQSGVSISRPRLSYRDGKTRFISGEYSIEEGLERMLRGTGFTFEVISPRSIRVIRRPKVVVQPVDVAHAVETEFVPVQEILVSSLRRTDLLQKLPYSISAFGGSQQEHLRATNTNDVVHRIASIYATKQGVGQNKVVIRGLSDGAFAGRAQALVSTYMDNARLTYNAPDPGLKLIDVDRIEVLRGPQGTLYGSGALSGLYRVVSRQPNTQETELDLKSSYAWTKEGDPLKEVSAIVNLPVVEGKVAIRGAGYFEQDGGYIDDERLGLFDVNSSKTRGGRIAALLQLNDVWQVTVGANYQRYKADDSNYYHGRRRRLQRSNYVREPRQDETRQLYFTVDADFGWATLTSNSSWMQRDMNRTLDGSLAVPKLVGLDVVASPFTEKRDIKTFTNETHLSSETGGQVEWILGSFYSRREEMVLSELVVPGSSANEFLDTDRIYSEDLTDDLKEYALFGELTYFVSEKVSLTAGLRWFRYDDKATSAVEDIGINFVSFVDGTQKKSGVTPKFVVTYHVDDDSILYGQVSQGYRVGGINLSGPNAVDIIAVAEGEATLPTEASSSTFLELANFDSDKLTNFEVGYKTDFLEGALTVNSAVFVANWTQIQALEYSYLGLPEVANVGDARVWGAEMEFFYRPHYQFELQGHLSLSDSKITKTNFSFGAEEGDPLPGAPKFSAGVSGRYEFDMGMGLTGSLSADYVYVGGADLLFNKFTTPRTDPYHLNNVRFSMGKGRWQVTVFANNLFDSKANSFAFGNPFSLEDPTLEEPIFIEPLDPGFETGIPAAGPTSDQFTPLRPRTVGVELGWRF